MAKKLSSPRSGSTKAQLHRQSVHQGRWRLREGRVQGLHLHQQGGGRGERRGAPPAWRALRTAAASPRTSTRPSRRSRRPSSSEPRTRRSTSRRPRRSKSPRDPPKTAAAVTGMSGFFSNKTKKKEDALKFTPTKTPAKKPSRRRRPPPPLRPRPRRPPRPPRRPPPHRRRRPRRPRRPPPSPPSSPPTQGDEPSPSPSRARARAAPVVGEAPAVEEPVESRRNPRSFAPRTPSRSPRPRPSRAPVAAPRAGPGAGAGAPPPRQARRPRARAGRGGRGLFGKNP